MTAISRSFLFVPADRPERLEKAAKLPVDAVVIELEDGVSPDKKAMARKTAGELLAETDFGGKTIALRPNRISCMEGIADIGAMADWPKKPDLILLSKVESAAEVLIYESLVKEMGVTVAFMLLIESSRGLFNAPSIVGASSWIASMSFGIADLSTELGCKPTWEVMASYRSSIVALCGLAGLAPIDPPYLDLKDPDGLQSECRKVRDMGYVGKLCIHPSQLEIVNDAFTPSAEDILQAGRILEAVKMQGTGAIVVDGRMVDKPVIRAAERTMTMAARLNLETRIG